MIQLNNITKTFNLKNGATLDAVKDVSLQVHQGEIFGIVGMSGAGKSTLIRIINRLEKPNKGTVVVGGHDITNLNDKELRPLRRNIGMIFQHFNLIQSSTVAANVAFPLSIAGQSKSEIDARVTELLELVGLSDKHQAYPNQLSGGQKQRVAIARALASNPDILLCDEATSALDPRTTASILELLQKINREFGLTIVLITHQIEVIRQVCHRAAYMELGEINSLGSVEKVLKDGFNLQISAPTEANGTKSHTSTSTTTTSITPQERKIS